MNERRRDASCMSSALSSLCSGTAPRLRGLRPFFRPGPSTQQGDDARCRRDRKRGLQVRSAGDSNGRASASNSQTAASRPMPRISPLLAFPSACSNGRHNEDWGPVAAVPGYRRDRQGLGISRCALSPVRNGLSNVTPGRTAACKRHQQSPAMSPIQICLWTHGYLCRPGYRHRDAAWPSFVSRGPKAFSSG